jgi:hypothetical protein
MILAFMVNPTSYMGNSISQEEWDEALKLAERWKDSWSGESYGEAGKNLGTLSRALLHLKRCYDEQVALNG